MAMNEYDVDFEGFAMCDGLFDNIDELLDFSTDDEVFAGPATAAGVVNGGADGFQRFGFPAAAATTFSSAIDEESQAAAPNSEENKVACEDINLPDDWTANFLDDTTGLNIDDFPAPPTAILMAMAAEEEAKDEPLFDSLSPVSVLEEPNNSISSSEKAGSSSASYSSSSSGASSTIDTVSMAPVEATAMPLVPARAARSKRPRPHRSLPTPAPAAIPILLSATEGPPAIPTLLPDCESFGESMCPDFGPARKKKKKAFTSAGSGDEGLGVRKCQHCGIQKTPQWRAGPTGPKTLCNACGVRYKSGRLFPEYRPAASPTFVPSLHSNSHKKVVEMRIKACEQKPGPSPENPAAKNCDLLAYIRGGDAVRTSVGFRGVRV